jgi:hypothetical protein
MHQHHSSTKLLALESRDFPARHSANSQRRIVASAAHRHVKSGAQKKSSINTFINRQ